MVENVNFGTNDKIQSIQDKAVALTRTMMPCMNLVIVSKTRKKLDIKLQFIQGV